MVVSQILSGVENNKKKSAIIYITSKCCLFITLCLQYVTNNRVRDYGVKFVQKLIYFSHSCNYTR